MEEKERNRKTELSDFLRYTKKEMTGQERNAFEKELQKDPFADEAMEGFADISPENAESDLLKLKKQLRNRTSRRQRFIYYSIAASVAVLMIISSLLIIIEKNKPSEALGKMNVSRVYFDIPAPKALQAPGTNELTPAAPIPEKHAERSQKPVIVPSGGENVEISEQINIESKKEPAIEKQEASAKELSIQEDRMAAPAMAAGKPVQSEVRAKGKVLSSEDEKPIPGATVVLKGTNIGVTTDINGNFSMTLPEKGDKMLVANYIGMESKEFQAKTDSDMEVKLNPSVAALNEVVVVGYGEKKSESLTTGYFPPEPINGNKSFNNYIEKNMRKPVTLAGGEKEVVVVMLKVLSTGSIDSIRVIRSPGTEFSNEAIRLIREGPAWKPAEKDGEKIDDEVRVRIVFR